MGAIVVGMVLTLGLAVLVLLAVALPRVRDGARLLSRGGEVQVRGAARRAVALSEQARRRAAATADDVRERVGARQVAGQPDRGDGAATQRAPAGSQPASVHPGASGATGMPAPDLGAPPTHAPAASSPPPVPRHGRSSTRAAESVHRAWQRMDWGEPRPGPRHVRPRD